MYNCTYIHNVYVYIYVLLTLWTQGEDWLSSYYPTFPLNISLGVDAPVLLQLWALPFEMTSST